MIIKILASIVIVGALALLYAFALSKNGSTPVEGSTPACNHDCRSCAMSADCSSEDKQLN